MRKLALIALYLYVQHAVAAEPALDCNNAISTPEINQCLSLDLESAEAVMSRYLEGSRAVLEEDAETLAALDAAQTAWKTYRDLHCGSVYSLWRDGTMRGMVYLSCQISETQVRTQDLWETFLVSGEGNAPDGFPNPAEPTE